MDRQVVAEDPHLEQVGEAEALQLREDDVAVARGDEPEAMAGSLQTSQRGLHPGKHDGAGAAVIARQPQLIGFIKPLGGDPQAAIHQPPVGRIVSAVEVGIERHAEGLHHRGVRVVERTQGIDEGAIPVEQDRLHRPIVPLARRWLVLDCEACGVRRAAGGGAKGRPC